MRKIIITIFVLFNFMFILPNPVYPDWDVEIQVSVPDPDADSGSATNRLILGVNQEATDDFDNRWDILALSKGGGGINSYFEHPEYSRIKNRLWQDFRSVKLPQEWKISTNSDIAESIQIKWKNEFIPDYIEAKFIDQNTGNQIDMRQKSDYSYTNSPMLARNFLVQISEKKPMDYEDENDNSNRKGLGCGYIKDIRLNGRSFLNMIAFFLPLIWLILYKRSLMKVKGNRIKVI